MLSKDKWIIIFCWVEYVFVVMWFYGIMLCIRLKWDRVDRVDYLDCLMIDLFG